MILKYIRNLSTSKCSNRKILILNKKELKYTFLLIQTTNNNITNINEFAWKGKYSYNLNT